MLQRGANEPMSALPRPVAVALGGGGVLGAAYAGVGHALEDRGFRPDLVVGTSIGALTGATAAAHPDRLRIRGPGLYRADHRVEHPASFTSGIS